MSDPADEGPQRYNTGDTAEGLVATMRREARRRDIVGTVYVFVALLGPPIVLHLLGGLVDESTGTVVTLAVAMSSVVGIILMALAERDKLYLGSIDYLKRIDPVPVITREYAVTQVGDVTVFTLRSHACLYFVRLDMLNALPADKIRVPRTVPWWKRQSVAGFKLNCYHDTFNVPTVDRGVISSKCTLYVLPLTGDSYAANYRLFTDEGFMSLVAAVSEASESEGSSDWAHL